MSQLAGILQRDEKGNIGARSSVDKKIALSNALHRVARARGVLPGAGSTCAYCGESPFDRHADLSAISEAVVALARYPDYEGICSGCRSILEGKPGSDPPPLRMQHVFCVGETIAYPPRAELRDIVLTPPADDFVASWATSKKKHHVLNAGISTAERQIWGSDLGPLLVLPEHRAVLGAIEALAPQSLEHLREGTWRPITPTHRVWIATHYPAVLANFDRLRAVIGYRQCAWTIPGADD